MAATLAARTRGPLVVVCPRADEVDALVDDLGLFLEGTVEQFLACETLAGERAGADEAAGERLRLLKMLQSPQRPRLVATSIQALVQPVPDRDALARQTRLLRVGERLSLEELARWLVENRFHATTGVELPGEFSLRGGIVDIFAPDWYDPVRMELLGDEIESIRRFEVSSQRSLGKLDAVEVTVLEPLLQGRGHFSDFLPPESWFLLVEPGELESEGRHYLERLERPQELHAVADVLREVCRFPSVTASAMAAGSLETTCRLQIESVERFSGDIDKVRDELDDAGAGQEVFLVCQTEAEVRRLARDLCRHAAGRAGPAALSPRARCRTASGWCPKRIVLLSSGELFRRADVQRPARRRLGRVIDSFLELHEGDLVVHLAHGIARYRGLTAAGEERAGRGAPGTGVSRARRSSTCRPRRSAWCRSTSAGRKSRPMLAKLGGHALGEAEEAGRGGRDRPGRRDARTAGRRGPRARASASRVETEWQHEFDASFPYEETPDQLTTHGGDQARHARQSRPMDRLLCGDVGYGKTEVAMRAAFKAVDSGYQVAVLVPTTVLAEQHLRTFTARMAEFPFEIAALSRFCHAAAAGRHHRAPGRRRGRHRHRHASAGAAGREVPQPGPGDHRRGAAVRRRGQGTPQGLAADGRRADDDRHADPAHAAHGPDGRARHLEPGDAARRPPGGGNPRDALRAAN